MNDDITSKDYMLLAIAFFFVALGMGGCQLMETYSEKMEIENKLMEQGLKK